MHTVFLLVKPKEKRELEDLGVDERVKKLILKEQEGKLSTGLIWLWIGKIGGFLRIW